MQHLISVLASKRPCNATLHSLCPSWRPKGLACQKWARSVTNWECQRAHTGTYIHTWTASYRETNSYIYQIPLSPDSVECGTGQSFLVEVPDQTRETLEGIITVNPTSNKDYIWQMSNILQFESDQWWDTWPWCCCAWVPLCGSRWWQCPYSEHWKQVEKDQEETEAPVQHHVGSCSQVICMNISGGVSTGVKLHSLHFSVPLLRYILCDCAIFFFFILSCSK